jgi:hypothetical protein
MDTLGPNQHSLVQSRRIEHYYGDYVRQLFVVAALLSIVVIPVLGNLLPFGTLVQVASAILLVILAGVTNPHSKTVMWYNTVTAGLSVLLLELAAIYQYKPVEMWLFMAREAVAIMLLFALYFSVKTIRAMSSGTIGHGPQLGEFDHEAE